MHEITHRTSKAFYENVRHHLKHYIMDKINLFDRYIRGEMTSDEERLFEQKLANDTETRTDLKIYAALVDGICKEEQQDNIDFAHAMKMLSEKELKRMIGKREKPRLKMHKFKQVSMWTVSMAAMLVICFSVTLHIQHTAERAVDDMIVEYNSMPISDRGGDDIKNLSDMSQDEIEEMIHKWGAQYSDIPKDDIQTKQMEGINLAMAYLKIHERKKAVAILEEVKALYLDDTEFVSQCDKILKYLK